MKANIFLKAVGTSLLLSSILISCNKETKQEEQKVGVVPPTSNPAFQNLDGSAPVNAAPVADGQTATPAPTTTAPGMNPPHGQPGHKCEIPVGAPLNSPPSQAPTAAAPGKVDIQPAPEAFMPKAVQQQPQASGTTAAGLNPPHGQPGHSCAIAVGAPLPK